ncbi:hypothetical protein WMF37_08660 [Sorangium sp. So ce291]|uniref:hypothetical protein n=1 Tax=Sorangium sp. So ce291 TaxID=3133294 RepID=UPI003F5F495E
MRPAFQHAPRGPRPEVSTHPVAAFLLSLAVLLTACAPGAEPAGELRGPPANALDDSMDPVVLKPEISPEFAIDAPVLSPAPGAAPAAAFNGTQYLVAWIDRRAPRPSLYGARLARDGAVLDPYGIVLLDDLATESLLEPWAMPAVATDGDDFLVVMARGGQLRGVRVDPGGVVLDPTGFAISTVDAGIGAPEVAFDGKNYLVAWPRAGDTDVAPQGIYTARVTPGGAVLDAGGSLAVEGPVCGALAVSFDGTNHLLTWRGAPDSTGPAIHGARVSPAGVVLDPSGFSISAPLASGCDKQDVAASFDGSNHVVLWSDSPEVDGQLVTSIRGARVTPEGSVLDPVPLVVPDPTSGSEYIDRIGAAFDGSSTTVAWSIDPGGSGYFGRMNLARIDPRGVVSVPPAAPPDNVAETALASNGAGVLVTWWATEHKPDELFSWVAGMRLDARGAAVDPDSITISTHANAEEVRAVASDGQIFFVLWSDARSPATDGRGIYGARVTADGTVLDPAGIQITRERADVMHVVHDGENFLVFWARKFEDSSNPLRGARVSPGGVVLDAAPIELPLCHHSWNYLTPRAASDGTHTLLVGNGCDRDAPTAVLLDQRGAAVSPATTLVPDPYPYSVLDASVAWSGTSYLVLLQTREDLRVRRVGAGGLPLDGAPALITPPGSVAYAGTLGAGGDNHLVIWRAQTGIFGMRLDPAGRSLDPEGFLITTATDDCSWSGCCGSLPTTGACPSIAFDGENFLVAWRSMEVPDRWSSLDLFGAAVSPSGVVGPPFVLSQEREMEGVAFLAANDEGRVLGAYTRFVAQKPYGARRANARLLREPADPADPTGTDGAGGADDGGAGGPTDEDLAVSGCTCRAPGQAATSSRSVLGPLLFITCGGVVARRRRKPRPYRWVRTRSPEWTSGSPAGPKDQLDGSPKTGDERGVGPGGSAC